MIGATIGDSTIIEAIEALWRPWFRDLDTWAPWFSFLRAMFGLPMTDADRAAFTRYTGRAAPSPAGYNEAWLIVGRRGGKSMMMATVAVFLAVFKDWSAFTVPGESALVQVIATNRSQARIVYRYARAMLTRVPVLKSLVVSDQDQTLELSNGISIEITTNSFRSVRGYTVVAALLDEVAYWRSDDAANPDDETLVALQPAMATVPGSVLICASSPYARRGALYDVYKEHWGKDSPALVWRASTREMNASFPQALVDRFLERDRPRYAAEYLAEFRSDIESYISQEAIDAAVVPGRIELPPVAGSHYVAFCDPSGGSSDSFTLAIAHREADVGVLDCIREAQPPFSPEAIVKDFAGTLERYGVVSVTGDRYAGEWPPERFREHGIRYEASELSKSEVYKELLPIMNSGKVELLDVRRLHVQLVSLERRTARGGRDSVDHPPGSHDDVANASAGAIVLAAGKMDTLAMWARL